jgi:hypothetical protein
VSFALGLTPFNRVNALAFQLATGGGFLARFDEWHIGERTKAHLAFTPAQRVAENPGLCASSGHLEIGPATIGVHAAGPDF